MAHRPMLVLLVLWAVTVVAGDNVNATTGWTKIGSFAVDVPGYAFLMDTDNDNELDLVVNSFAPFAPGAVRIGSNASGMMAALRQGEEVSSPQAIFEDLFWPNWAELAPPGIFDSPSGNSLVVPDGFLLPGSTPGAIYILDLAENGSLADSHSITGGKTMDNYDLFYALAEFVDVRGDGTMDVLATRVRAAAGGIYESAQLMLLTQPEDPNADAAWNQTHLADDVDFAFVTEAFEDVDGVRKLGIFGGSFSEEKLSYYVMDLSTSPPTMGEEIVVDADCGPMYSTQIIDVNGDGVRELLVSNHEMRGSKGAVYVYALPEDPNDWAAADFTRTTLTEDFPMKTVPGEAAPGFPLPYYASADAQTGPQEVIVQGDNNGYVYVLKPTDPYFGYDRLELAYFGDPVGMPALADVDGDGWMDMFIPDYANNLVHIYTTAEA